MEPIEILGFITLLMAVCLAYWLVFSLDADGPPF